MALSNHFVVDHLPTLLAGVAMLAMTAWLALLKPRTRATLALSFVLFGTGLSYLHGALVEWHPEPEAPIVMTDADVRTLNRQLFQVEFAAIALATLYFLLVFPRPRGWVGRSPRSWIPFAAAFCALAAVAFIDFDLYAKHTLQDGESQYEGAGPLVFVYNLWTVGMGVMCVVLAHEIRRAPAGAYRRSLLLVFAGYSIYAMQWAVSLGLNDVMGRLRGNVWPNGYDRTVYLLDELSGVLAFVGIAMLLPEMRTGRPERASVAAAVGAGLLSGAAAVATFVFGAPVLPEDTTSLAQSNLDSAAAFLLPLLIAYALVKHQLFDIDVKLRWTVSRGTLAAVFLGVFFVAAELAQNFLSNEYGWALGGLTAGLLLFAISPIQRVAERVASVAVPTVLTRDEKKRDLYGLAVSVALADGLVTREEERHLARLAEELHLGHAEALEIRERLEREMGIAA